LPLCRRFVRDEGKIVHNRTSPRFPHTIELRVGLLTRVDVLEEPKLLLDGVTENVGRGGICVLLDEAVPQNSVVRCVLSLPDISMNIPTLMQVRWAQRINGKSKYKAGLQFLI
jgi:hypothetical protein